MVVERDCPRNGNVWRCWVATATENPVSLPKFVRALCLPAKHRYPARSSPAIGCQATTNSAGIVLSDRSFGERSFGYSTPGLLVKRAAPISSSQPPHQVIGSSAAECEAALDHDCRRRTASGAFD